MHPRDLTAVELADLLDASYRLSREGSALVELVELADSPLSMGEERCETAE